jgi:hypothetical protein
MHYTNIGSGSSHLREFGVGDVDVKSRNLYHHVVCHGDNVPSVTQELELL